MEREMRTLALIIIMALATAPAAAGKLYKWVDQNGEVHYTDQPPPPEAKTAEHRKFGDQATDAPVPYAVQQAAKSFPVTLYTADQCGDPCSKGSALLAKRGVPFTEKNVRDAALGEELKALNGGKLEVPVIKIGSQVVRGYEEGNWNGVLDAAGYPKWAPARPATAPSKPVAKAAESPAPNSAPESRQ